MESLAMKWQALAPDETALAGPEHLDAAHVAGYDRKAAFDPTNDVWLLREKGLRDESTLIDVSAGTGTLALAAAPYCGRVIAVDVSPAMVAAIEAKAAERGLPNVDCVQAGFISYEHQGAQADFVYSRNALHHLPDFWKAIALARLNAMLRPGGILRLRDIVFAFELADAEKFITEWLDTGAERPEDGWTRAEFVAHLREEHSTFNWLLEPMIESAGFEIEHADYGSRRIYAEYLCMKRR